MDPDLDLDDDVLAAAAALIDDVYALSSGSETTSGQDRAPSRRRIREQHQVKVDKLESEIAELEESLRVVRNEQCGNSMGKLWEEVALGQGTQVENLLVENARLRDIAQEHISDAQQIKKLLAESLQLTQTSRLCEPIATPIDAETMNSAQLEAVIRQRLRRTTFASDPPWACPRASIDAPFWDRASQCDERGNRLVIRNRYAAFFPFKLSIVVDVFWDLVNERDPETHGNTQHETELSRQVSYVMEESYGRTESCGLGLFRRQYQPDGSVLFTWGSITFPPPNDTDVSTNLLVGMEVQETGWGRATRVSGSRQQSLVYFEHVALKEIKPSVDGDRTTQLKHLEEFMQRVSVNHNPTGWQRLENGVLDASASIRARP